MSSLQIVFDETVGRNISGWTGLIDADADERDAVRLEAYVADRFIGEIARNLKRPDVVAAHGDHGVDNGFLAPILALLAFRQMGGTPQLTPISVIATDGRQLRVAVPDDLLGRTRPRLRPLALVNGLAGLKLEDAWFATTHDLRLRIAVAPASGEVKFEAYQTLHYPAFRICSLAEQTIGPDGALLVSIRVQNPLFPILIVIKDEQNQILETDIVPFPSLIRGGVHYPELRAGAVLGSDINDLARLSEALMWTAIGEAGAPPPSLGAIVVGRDIATGGEPIFDSDMLEWLSAQMRIPVRLDERSQTSGLDEDIARLLAARLAAAGPGGGERGPIELFLPADALPTISVLLDRALYVPGVGGHPPFVMTHTYKTPAVWEVRMPPLPGGEATARLPALMHLAEDDATILPRQGALRPVAIRCVEPAMPQGREVLFPVDLDGITVMPAADLSVSICVAAARSDVSQLGMTLESIAAQTGSGAVEVLVGLDASFAVDMRGEWENAVARILPGRGRVVDTSASSSLAAALNAIAAQCVGTVLVFVAPGTILVDERTVARLSTLAAREDIASVSCALVVQSPNGFSHASSGYFLSAFSGLGAPAAAYHLPDMSALFTGMEYPVAANPLELMAADRARFESLGGFDEQLFGGAGCDVDFGLRAINVGFYNLFTGNLTAVIGVPPLRGIFDVAVAERFPRLSQDLLASRTTSVRRLF